MNHPKTWSGQDIPDQSVRTVLVTGANSGTGFETAMALARDEAVQHQLWERSEQLTGLVYPI